jgi:hypothetical protein
MISNWHRLGKLAKYFQYNEENCILETIVKQIENFCNSYYYVFANASTTV